jgi:hypothetical protein
MSHSPVPGCLAASLVGSLTLLLCPSCGPKVKLYAARGQVFVAGKPAEGAVVVLHPVPAAPGAPTPSGRVAADGSFTLGTFQAGDGAPAGDYVVAIAWRGDVARANPVTGEVPTKLSPTYADPAQSPLRARITEGANDIPAFHIPR